MTTRINITHRLIVTGDDRLQMGDLGIQFSTKGFDPEGKRQKTKFQIRGPHRQWLKNRRENTTIYHEQGKFIMYLLFRSDYNAAEFKLRFL